MPRDCARSLGVGSAKFVGVLVSLILVGKMGRRTLLLLGTTAEIVFLLAMAISSFTLEVWWTATR